MTFSSVTLYDYVVIQFRKYKMTLHRVTCPNNNQPPFMLLSEDCNCLESQDDISTKMDQVYNLTESESKIKIKEQITSKHVIKVNKTPKSVDNQHKIKQPINNITMGFLSDLDRVFLLFKNKEISCYKLDKKIKARQLLQAHKIWFYEKYPTIIVKFNSFKGHKINHLYKVCYRYQYKNKYTDEFILKKYWYSPLNYRMSYVLLSGV
jgi:hypothetical protein